MNRKTLLIKMIPIKKNKIESYAQFDSFERIFFNFAAKFYCQKSIKVLNNYVYVEK